MSLGSSQNTQVLLHTLNRRAESLGRGSEQVTRCILAGDEHLRRQRIHDYVTEILSAALNEAGNALDTGLLVDALRANRKRAHSNP
jgi:hypothetical protein